MPISSAYIKLLDQAFRHFNKELFEGKLKPVLFNHQRSKKSAGHFWAEKIQHREDGSITEHEISLNPDIFIVRTDEQILSTLVHEMVHEWQHEYGERKSRAGYHNREWAEKMESVGLMPTSTGKPGGMKTGQHMTHYIMEDGPYACSYLKLRESGFKLPLQSRPQGDKDKGKRESKTKFTCPSCGINAWGKDSLEIDCHQCKVLMLSAT